ncbi:MAG: cysteine hydrolase family protein [Candidatus Planktophila sp.]|nr:cysteine hydrolase family protein [Candidatus Planktophila sp.]
MGSAEWETHLLEVNSHAKAGKTTYVRENCRMSLFENRGKSALLVIDVQNGVVDNAFGRESVIAHISEVITKARAMNVPVIWVQHSDEELEIGSDSWKIVPELEPGSDEVIIRKLFRSSFVETQLSELLASLGVDHLYITGAQTNNCVRHTCHGALELGYDITLISDAHTTSSYEWKGRNITAQDVINEQNDNLSGYRLPGRKAKVVESAAITF